MSIALRNGDWRSHIPEEDWAHYREVMLAAQARDLPFAIGGGFAFSHYAGRWRNTKDLDLYILPEHRAPFVELLNELRFADYHEKMPYDRGWIYRGWRADVIVDLIWESANHYRQTDLEWLTHGAPIDLRGLQVRLLPVEELIWAKLFVLQRDRCDWPDLLNVLNNWGERIDWPRLFRRVGNDTGLLGGLLSVFAWLAPQRAAALPSWIWERTAIARPPGDPSPQTGGPSRVQLLDSRDWYGKEAVGP